jgi:hypothetical protein
MKRYPIFLVLCLAALLAACSNNQADLIVGSAKVITETRPVNDFTSLELGCSADVILAQGPLAVSIEGEDNILPLIETRVSGGKLIIDSKPNSNFRSTKPIVIHIAVPKLSSIQVSASGDVDIDGFTAASLDLNTSGSGNIRLQGLQADSVKATISGSGGMTLDGKTGQLTVKDSASGNFTGTRLESRQANVTLTGSGDATVWVTYSLSATLSASGNLMYYGAAGLDQKVTGSGNVEKLGDQP